MSKVDEWLLKMSEGLKSKPKDFSTDNDFSASISIDTGRIIIDGIIVEKEDALRFADWIIENYSCNYDSLIEARDMIKEAKKLIGVDNE